MDEALLSVCFYLKFLSWIIIGLPCYVSLRYALWCVASCFGHVWLCMTLWTAAHQVCLSMGLSRQEYWGALSCSSPGNLPDPGIKPKSLVSPASAGRFFTTSTTWEAQFQVYSIVIQYFYALQNDHHNKSSYPLSLYKVIILLLAIFSMLDKPGRIDHQLALMSWFYRLKKNKQKTQKCTMWELWVSVLLWNLRLYARRQPLR